MKLGRVEGLGSLRSPSLNSTLIPENAFWRFDWTVLSSLQWTAMQDPSCMRWWNESGAEVEKGGTFRVPWAVAYQLTWSVPLYGLDLMVHTQYVAIDAGRFGCNTDTYNYLLLSGNSLSFVFYFILFFHVHRHPDKIPILQGLGERLFCPSARWQNAD